ncbi:MAG: hypothetical protein AAFV29_09815 [Myxococcota bacterium]
MADQKTQELLIHEVVDSVQQSIDIADRTSRKKYNFALSEMEIKMTLNFDIKEDKTQTTSKKPRSWLSLFSRRKDPALQRTTGDSEDDQASMTLRMLFKPGGKLFMAQGDDDSSDDSDSTDTSSDSSDDSDSDSDDY